MATTMKALVLTVTLACAGCATVSSSSTRYVGVPAVAPSNPDRVQILRAPPTRPHERIGEVRIEPSGDVEVVRLEEALREETAKIGGDAVVVVYDGIQATGASSMGGYWNRSVYVTYDRVVVGVAIRYTAAAPATATPPTAAPPAAAATPAPPAPAPMPSAH